METLTAYSIVNKIVMTDRVRQEIEKYRKEFTSFHSLKSIETEILNNGAFSMPERMRIFFEVAAYLFGVEQAEQTLETIVSSYNQYDAHFGISKKDAMEAFYGR